ncbi:tripartite tricarboxylate transporter permease [Stappia sp. TSB10GB4]|uniref:tripartite tricarboxylate transporter permease n=1 Tax=Stappia sp. TSB10GB4 TaxID=2003584 RepID=UPI0016459D57|nr:tripartite tricarboxylate transporter permease [Stappia sp. TSB10GB4]
MGGMIEALGTIFSMWGLACLLAGTAIGIVVGALPGLGPSIGISLLIPFTYTLSPELSMLLLVSLYMGAEYGGSVSAILLSTPGTAAAASTALDGYAMTRQGRANEALAISLGSSAVGGVIGGLALLVLAGPLASLALKFGPAGYFAVGLFGLTSVAALSGGSLVKGLLGAAFGLAIATVGIDPIAGVPRFTFGFIELYEGVPFLTALIGLFAVSEALVLAEKGIRSSADGQGPVRSVLLRARQWRDLFPTMLSGSVIGTLLGILPGVGGNIACWIARDFARRRDKDPDSFGHGAEKGVAAPEAANNATVGGALIPLLSLGVPGSPTTAVLVGALILHGLRPGPQLFSEAPALVYSILIGVIVSALAMFAVGTLCLPIWARAIRLPRSVIATGIMAFAVLGAFALRNLVFDVSMMLLFGLLGYVLKKLRFSVAPIVLAMVLGYLVESNYRTALVTSQGSYSIFVTDPISLTFLILSAVSLILPILRSLRSRRRSAL